MVVIELIDNGARKFPLQYCKTPQELKDLFKLAARRRYTVNIIQGWDYCWVQTAKKNHQEELEAAE